MFSCSVHRGLHNFVKVTRSSTRSSTTQGRSAFEKFQQEKLQYRPEKDYYEKIEGRNSSGRSLRDATELHDIQPEGCRIPDMRMDD
ncbi:hypothetical protein KPH14_003068 [Odynerus spinipes]|uniref:Uncharacterized protein n=1 Tax=Odynerus spinipes TaxID=1348599 RepID=A0AAD9RWU6_9HYME|nr:hypothetical protein KPH14_003068 [Odynerus spinipes]